MEYDGRKERGRIGQRGWGWGVTKEERRDGGKEGEGG